MAIELFNYTAYNDKALIEALEYTAELMNVKGDVACTIRYEDRSGWAGTMWGSHPYFSNVVKQKRFQHRGYMVRRGDYRPSTDYTEREADREIKMATKDGAVGYIRVRVPRPTKCGAGYHTSFRVLNTMAHEMGHVWQFRNRQAAIKDSGARDWNDFRGYTNKRSYRRTKYSDRIIEVHVREMLKRVTIDDAEVTKLSNAFSSVTPKQKKVIKRPKTDIYGNRIANYRNVKMNTLRDGTKLHVCPCCGDKAIVKLNYHNPGDDLYLHVASKWPSRSYWHNEIWDQICDEIEGCVVHTESGRLVATIKDTWVSYVEERKTA